MTLNRRLDLAKIDLFYSPKSTFHGQADLVSIIAIQIIISVSVWSVLKTSEIIPIF